MGEWERCILAFDGKTEKNWLLGTTRRRYEDNNINNLYINRIVEWTGLIWLRIWESIWFL